MPGNGALPEEQRLFDWNAVAGEWRPRECWRVTYGDGYTALYMVRSKREAVEVGERRRPGEWVIRALPADAREASDAG